MLMKFSKIKNQTIGILFLIVAMTLFVMAVTEVTKEEINYNINQGEFEFKPNTNGLITIYDNSDKVLGEIGLVVTGNLNNQSVNYKSLDYIWSYNIEKELINVTKYNNVTNENGNIIQEIIDKSYYNYNMSFSNNDPVFLWKQDLIFKDKRNPKLSNTITNNMGNMENVKFWYVNIINKYFFKSHNTNFFPKTA